ncbi:MAG: hypothetical protein CM15mP108_3110 [Gammaproteobacteria bacterium]|nr:MAG: hypothetical protein CM15mP108_3110 [Gammaproteobacteria bacterium]
MSDVNKISPFGELKSISSKNCIKALMSSKPFKGIFSIINSASFRSMLGKMMLIEKYYFYLMYLYLILSL